MGLSKPDHSRWTTSQSSSNFLEPSEGKKDIGWQAGERPPNQYMNWLQNKSYEWEVYSEHQFDRIDSLILGSGALLNWSGTQITFSSDISIVFKFKNNIYTNTIDSTDSPIALADGEAVVAILDESNATLTQVAYGSITKGDYSIVPLSSLTENTSEHEVILFWRSGGGLVIPQLRQILQPGLDFGLGEVVPYVQAGQKFWWDGVSNTYTWEVSPNVIQHVCAGVPVVNYASTVARFLDGVSISVKSGQKIHVDDIGDTYFIESSPNRLDTYAGGYRHLSLISQSGDGIFAVQGYDNGITGSELRMYHERNGSPLQNGDNLGVHSFRGLNSVSAETNFISIKAIANVVTDGAEESTLTFSQMLGGAFAVRYTFKPDGLLLPSLDPPPAANYMTRGAVPKAWLDYNDDSGSTANSFNIDSVGDDDGDGLYDVNLDLDYASTGYSTVANYQTSLGVSDRYANCGPLTNGSIRVTIFDISSVGGVDGDFQLISIGDQ
ncbi:MAG: hypothetical protein GWN93_27035 [Deltaproteobacteria bacterium]|nr:hypothetical protein [Deltaproteobacteria bacterium]